MFGIPLKERRKMVFIVIGITLVLTVSAGLIPFLLRGSNEEKVNVVEAVEVPEKIEVISRWLKSKKYHIQMHLIEYDGCEYLGANRGLTHKANCKNEIHKAVKNVR